MSNPTEQQWNACLKYIKDNVGEQSFSTWFTPAEFKSFDGSTLRVKVPSGFFYEYWESHFLRIIHSAIQRYFGKNVGLTYVYGDDDEQIDAPTRVHAEIPEPTSQNIEKQGPNDFFQTLTGRYPQELNPELNPNYTFDNFIEGSSNRFPRKIALTIAEKFQDTFNPFFIYGHSGVGKTHLANAIGVKIKEEHPEKRVLYVSAHLFYVQYTQSILKNKFNDFMNFYQSIDTLIIDDIQEIAGKKKTQEAFFNIFNHLQHNRRQLILTCDRPPVLLEGMQERLLSRFNWGIIAELERPDARLRFDVVRQKVKENALPFPQNVMRFIAENVQTSIREIEGVINSIMAFAVTSNHDIDMMLAEKTIARTVRLNSNPITTGQILAGVGKQFKVTPRELVSSSRKRHIVNARQVSMYLCQKYTKLSSAQIGQKIGGRDHSTVLHSCTMAEKRIKTDKDFRQQVEAIEQSLLKP